MDARSTKASGLTRKTIGSTLDPGSRASGARPAKGSRLRCCHAVAATRIAPAPRAAQRISSSSDCRA